MKDWHKRIISGFVAYVSMLGIFYMIGGSKLATDLAIGAPLVVVFITCWAYAIR